MKTIRMRASGFCTLEAAAGTSAATSESARSAHLLMVVEEPLVFAMYFNKGHNNVPYSSDVLRCSGGSGDLQDSTRY